MAGILDLKHPQEIRCRSFPTFSASNLLRLSPRFRSWLREAAYRIALHLRDVMHAPGSLCGAQILLVRLLRLIVQIQT